MITTRAAALACATLLLAGCTGATSGGSPSSDSATTAVSRPAGPSSGPVTPVPRSSGPTTTARATECPLVRKSYVHFTMGLRLGRLTVQRSGGHVVGCRFYPLAHPDAQCGDVCFQGEHLPPASQPVVQIALRTYTTSDGAYNAFVLASRKGTAAQTVQVQGRPGVCFRNDFYDRDKGQDWACGSSKGPVEVEVHTVDTTETTNTVAVTRKVLGRL